MFNLKTNVWNRNCSKSTIVARSVIACIFHSIKCRNIRCFRLLKLMFTFFGPTTVFEEFQNFRIREYFRRLHSSYKEDMISILMKNDMLTGCNCTKERRKYGLRIAIHFIMYSMHFSITCKININTISDQSLKCVHQCASGKVHKERVNCIVTLILAMKSERVL